MGGDEREGDAWGSLSASGAVADRRRTTRAATAIAPMARIRVHRKAERAVGVDLRGCIPPPLCLRLLLCCFPSLLVYKKREGEDEETRKGGKKKSTTHVPKIGNSRRRIWILKEQSAL